MSNWIEKMTSITSGDRQRDYGHPMTNFLRICIFWSQFLGVAISPRQFVHMMTLMKIARDQHSFKADNHIDIMGYEAGLSMVYDRMRELELTFNDFEDEDHGLRNMQTAYELSLEKDEELCLKIQ